MATSLSNLLRSQCQSTFLCWKSIQICMRLLRKNSASITQNRLNTHQGHQETSRRYGASSTSKTYCRSKSSNFPHQRAANTMTPIEDYSNKWQKHIHSAPKLQLPTTAPNYSTLLTCSSSTTDQHILLQNHQNSSRFSFFY